MTRGTLVLFIVLMAASVWAAPASLKKTLDECPQKTKDAKTKYSKATWSYRASLITADKASERLSSHESNVQDQEDKLQAAQQEKQTLQSQLQQSQKDKEEQKKKTERVKGIRKDISKLKASLTAQKKKLKQLEEDLKKEEDKVAADATDEDAKKEVTRLKKEVKAQKAKVAKTTKDINNKTKAADDMTKSITKKNKEISKTQVDTGAKYDATKKDIKKKQEQLESLKGETESFEKKKKAAASKSRLKRLDMSVAGAEYNKVKDYECGKERLDTVQRAIGAYNAWKAQDAIAKHLAEAGLDNEAAAAQAALQKARWKRLNSRQKKLSKPPSVFVDADFQELVEMLDL